MAEPKVLDEPVYTKNGNSALFNQLALKIEMDSVSQQDYYAWLDDATRTIGAAVPGAQIAEKENARKSPPLNTAVYYDTADHRVLPTGALLRTSCNKITHAFCAYKGAHDEHSVRRDYRYIFDGAEKSTIQDAPASDEAVSIVYKLLRRTDIQHPGILLQKEHGIDPTQLTPALLLEDYRYTFFVWLDGKDALRCSLDRAFVSNLRLHEDERSVRPVSEVELAIYPHISDEIAGDTRVVSLIKELSRSLCERFDTRVTTDIKYQRSAKSLGIAD
ncbi:hypothetical protein ACGFYQ_10645 [Streptomyces sp. NPDC048258]|uniref:hypothetical protein n=1 Tax=Streptomyces sp. NPDC048258 TaxID=3365527 RepID=UPI003713BB2D